MTNSGLSGWILILFLCMGIASRAQIAVKGNPSSTLWSMPLPDRGTYEVTPPAMDSVRIEDLRFPSPYRYSVNLPVNLLLIRDAKKETLPDGKTMWRIVLHASGAKGITVYFDRFILPQGGRLFLYDPMKTKVLGAFTELNNSREGYFATELIPGDQVVLEYDQPATVWDQPVVHISEIAYAYRGAEMILRGVAGFGSSGPCEVNISCPEGDNWREQAKGVALISVKKGTSSYFCTGSLVNNVRNDHIPYFLTADHCGVGATATDLLQWIFYFHYESPSCLDPVDPPVPKTTTGAFLKAHGGDSGNTGSDFWLMRLTKDVPVDYDVYFNGWSRETQPSGPGVTIHHPEGDIKKISTYTAPLISAIYGGGNLPCFWKVFWVITPDGYGVTERGSSGSPVFDATGRIVGTLTGGASNCDPLHLGDPDYYGKFSWSWESNGTDSTSRLRDWLDPDSTGTTSIAGIPLGIGEPIHTMNIQVFPNPFKTELNIRFQSHNRHERLVRVFNLMGETVFAATLPSGSELVSFSLSALPAGVYFLKIYDEKESFIQKIIRL